MDDNGMYDETSDYVPLDLDEDDYLPDEISVCPRCGAEYILFCDACGYDDKE